LDTAYIKDRFNNIKMMFVFEMGSDEKVLIYQNITLILFIKNRIQMETDIKELMILLDR